MSDCCKEAEKEFKGTVKRMNKHTDGCYTASSSLIIFFKIKYGASQSVSY